MPKTPEARVLAGFSGFVICATAVSFAMLLQVVVEYLN
jgi:hypothetical protein